MVNSSQTDSNFLLAYNNHILKKLNICAIIPEEVNFEIIVARMQITELCTVHADLYAVYEQPRDQVTKGIANFCTVI